MAGLDIDTSSYPKPAALPTQKTVLDQVGQFQQLESQNLAISQQKLKLYNDHFNLINDELSTLANDPKTTPQEVMTRMHRRLDAFQAPPNVKQMMESEFSNLPNGALGKDGVGNPELARRLDFAKRRAQSINERVNSLYGSPGSVDDGSSVTPSRTFERGGPVPSAAPIAKQPGPAQVEFDPNNQPRFRGVVPPELPPGASRVPGGFPSQYRLPIAPTDPNFRSGLSNDTPNNVVAQRMPAGAPAGPTPLFEEGRKDYTRDQENAVQKASAAKPAIQALQLMKTPGFNSGPGTEAYTKAVALGKTWGLIDTAKENDITAVTQDIIKKLHDYVSRSPVGQRSDAAQTLKEASSPNPSVQILPALKKLTEDAIALDRVEIARPNAFKTKNYEDYGKHRATFPQSMDEKAFTLDFKSEADSEKLVDAMAKQLKSTNKREAAQADKFFNSLRIAEEAGFYK